MRFIRLSPYPTIGRLEGEAGPQNSLSTEYVAPGFRKKKMDRTDIVIFTHGFLSQMMVVVGSQKPQPQSSMARPIRSVWELSGFDVPISQCA